MKILETFTLRGPNIWSRRPVLEAWVDLEDLVESPSDSLPGFNDRFMSWLPTMIEHRCSIGERGGFFQRLRDGTYPAHILEHTTIELQNLAGSPVGFGKARESSTPGIYRVVVRYEDEELARECMRTALELFLAAVHDRPFDVGAEVARLRTLADRLMLGPSTQAIVKAAEARGIPARRLNAGSLVQLGQGCRARRVWTAETDRTSAVGETIAQDKQLTKSLLRSAGVPVPDGRAVTDAADAWEAARELDGPVVVKPLDANHGRAVCIGLRSRELIEKAFAAAADEGTGVIVERCAEGEEHRLLVVGGRLVTAVRGFSACVVGDGRATVRQLVESQLNSDPRRGWGDDTPLNPVELLPPVLLELERQGHGLDSIPADGERVLIQRFGNLAHDITDKVHPTFAAQAVLAAKVVGLDVAGIDVVAQDISRPLDEQGALFIEVNSGPGLHPHLMPAEGEPRPVGEAIVESLFPAGQNGRIPVVCVTGTNGKTTVSRLVAAMLSSTGRRVGLATTDGLFVGTRRIDRGDCAGPRSASKLMLNLDVEAAVCEAGRGGILREGLGFDRCELAVVTNIAGADHLGRHSVETPEDMFTVKRSPVDVVLPSGCAVLNAADPLVLQMAPLSAGAVTLFALDATLPALVEHRSQGKRAVFVRDGEIVLAEGAVEIALMPVAAVPATHGARVAFQTENALAAAAAGWWLKVPLERIREGLAAFGATSLEGRFELFSKPGGPAVVVDDCHNPSALEALGGALARFAQSRRTAVYSCGACRRDADLVRQGEQLASLFDRVVLYDDASAFDRGPGEARALLRQGLGKGARVREVIEIAEHRQAIAAALASAGPDDLVVVQTEDSGVGPALSAVRTWLEQGEKSGGPEGAATPGARLAG